MAFRFRFLIGEKGLQTLSISAGTISEAIRQFNIVFSGQNVTVVDVQKTKGGSK